jgi:D-alanine-D-alanine ligase
MRVAVLAGGRSSEHDVSLDSAVSVREGLVAAGHDVIDVRIARSGKWLHEDTPIALEPGSGLLDAEAAFPVLHGPFGEDGTVQGLLELLDVPYVGAGVLASALCMDKVVFKEVLAAAAVPQVRYVAVRQPRWQLEPSAVRAELAELGLPAFVKPARLGSSVGIVKVTDADEIDGALETAFRHDGLVIVEAFSDGLEVECSVLGMGEPEASLPGEIVLKGSDWYDYAAKYEPGRMELVVPARVSESVRAGGAPPGARDVRARGLRRPRAGGLLRRRRARPGQRAQHDAGVHVDERLSEALGGHGHPLPGPVRPAARDRARALPHRARRPRLLGAALSGAARTA